MGYFPMADEDDTIEWFRTYERCVFPIEGVHVSRSLAKTIRSGRFEIRFNTAFEDVMRACRRPDGNWINEEIIHAYTAVHREGWAHCGECWADGELVGGIYGVAIGTCFSAESMFHRTTDASKVALWAMVNRCRVLGFTVFDAQVMNPHLASMGAVTITQVKYMRLLGRALQGTTLWSAPKP